MVQRVGIIGLGDIGKPMANCVVASGFHVSSSANRNREAIEDLKCRGLVELANPYEVARNSDVLISMVVDEVQNDAILRGDRGALAGLEAGSVIVVMSTVSPEYCQKLSLEAAEAGIDVLDCPVSGGRDRASRGELSLICGGDPAVAERCRPILEAMGTIFNCGEIGMGQIVKLANNALVGSQFQLVQEVRALSSAYGMALDELMGILRTSSGTSFVVENWDYLEGDWKHFGPMVKKDLDLCLEAAKARRVDMPMVGLSADLTSK